MPSADKCRILHLRTGGKPNRDVAGLATRDRQSWAGVPRLKQIVLPGTGLSVSRLILGTASLFNVGDKRARHRLIDAAIDAGFSHFDTAPLYGFGMAERDLGDVLRHRDGITLTTKVGLYAPGGEEQSALRVTARKALGRVVPALSRAQSDFSADRARNSLDASLRRLRRDRIDLYMLHEPDIATVDVPRWIDWLAEERARGRIGAFGIAADADRLGPFLTAGGPLIDPLIDIVQTTDSLARREADAVVASGRALAISYGYVSAARRLGDRRPVPTVLAEAIALRPGSAIIVSTTKIDRLGQYSAITDA